MRAGWTREAAAAAAAEGEALALQLLFPRERRRQQEGEVVLCVEGTPIRDALTEGLLQDAPASPPSSTSGAESGPRAAGVGAGAVLGCRTYPSPLFH